ncbi:MAG: T9SS type A sorting domain-containing protein [Candidatus Azobacteroides sp.]|nr:T9SS type A sorting domain-containing protein [Candidatus Azobacteroides sp.]
MKKQYRKTMLLLLACLMAGSGSSVAEELQLAFPGAEGFGKYATGGRGGRVIEVTTLDDYSESGETPIEGSLRSALKTEGDDPITIVFRVAGVITLKERLKCGRHNITIAGQTAPGDGICIAGNNIYFYGKNFIIRYLRFRTGDEQGVNASCVNVENAENFIIDHCSFSWSMEENMTTYDNMYSTVQWCIVSEPLYQSVHDKGKRGYGSQWGGQYASYHHNLIAHAYSRAPRVNGSRAHDTMAVTDFVNNVIYNWGKKNSVYGGESELEGGACHTNWVNNYYKPGPASPSGSYFAEASYNAGKAVGYGKWYVTGNYIDAASYATVNEDNHKGMNYQGGEENQRSDERFEVEDVPTTTAHQAYLDVLAGAGARIPKPDAIDRRILAEAAGERNPVYGGVLGSTKGIIDTQETVGGWPEYTYDPADVPADTDKDGIPDEWEIANGLDPNDPADGAHIAGNGYSNLENYLNSIEETITGIYSPEQNKNNKICISFDAGQQILYINSSEEVKHIGIYDVNGKNIYNWSLNTMNAYLPVENIWKGFYIIQIETGKSELESFKMIF